MPDGDRRLKPAAGTRGEEVQIERPDGTVILASANIDPLYDENGRIVGAINVFEDITERKLAEERLQTIYKLSEAVNRAEAVEQIYEQAFAALERVLHVDRVSILLLDGHGRDAFSSLARAFGGVSPGGGRALAVAGG